MGLFGKGGVLLWCLAMAISGDARGEGSREALPLTQEQTAKLLERALAREPFVPDGRNAADPATLGKFFSDVQYEKLRGNPFLGYWDSGSFRWSGRRVAWGGMRPVGDAAGAISAKAWRMAFEVVARKRGLVVDDGASIRVEGACVAANLLPSKERPAPMVGLELKYVGSSGTLLHRVALPKPTVEEAMAATLDFSLGFALRVHQAGDGGAEVR